MDVIGTIINAIQLAELIHYTVVTVAEAEKDEKELASQIKLSAVILRRFIAMFSKPLSTSWSDNDAKEVADIAKELEPPMQQMKNSVVKMLPGSPRLKRWGGRITWLAYRKREFESLAHQMHTWGALFDQLIGTLSEDVKSHLLGAKKSEEPEVSSMVQMRSLSSLFKNLALTSKDPNLPDLERTFQDLTILGTTGNLQSAMIKEKSVLIEYKSYNTDPQNTAKINELREQMNRLTNFLKVADPLTTGILRAAEYIHDSKTKHFGLLFNLPTKFRFPQLASPGNGDKSPLKTLHSVISQGTPSASNPNRVSYSPRHPLNERIRIARTVATAVLYIHTCDWVHESIRSHNILMLEETTTKDDDHPTRRLGSPFVIGFDASRSADGFSSMDPGGSFDAIHDFNLAIYQHPDRQTSAGDDKIRFQMCHDRYSLGVVLLEIGLWMPLEKVHELRKIKEGDNSKPEEVHAKIKSTLIDLAKGNLSIIAGTAYQQLVLYCLNGDVRNPGSVADFSNMVVSKLWSINASLSL